MPGFVVGGVLLREIESARKQQYQGTGENMTEAMMTDINRQVTAFGRLIFQAIGKNQPSAFNKNFWSGKIMNWSMTQPDFKLNMFRLVDVLPSLRSSESIAAHVNEYLGTAAKNMNGLMEWGLNVDPSSLRAKVTSLIVKKSVRQMASQFIAGETPSEALKELRRLRKENLCFTVDLLGEYSVSEKEAQVYQDRYMEALNVFGREVPKWPESNPLIPGHPGELNPVCISVKLSALYSQCDVLNYNASVNTLAERLTTIARRAKELNALLYVDAEDVGNNELIYEAFKQVFGSDEFKDFPYPGAVVQAYARRSGEVIDDLLDFARKRGGPIAIRLVKGAYWDSETVIADQNEWPSPLFGQKQSSDAQFELLTRKLFDNHDVCFPAIGSHNIRSLAHACCYAESKGISKKQFELQMLYGMAEPIALAFAEKGFLVRMYVPLGEMIPGMGYLVRRLLENTSNESFLRHTFHDENEVDTLLQEPRFLD